MARRKHHNFDLTGTMTAYDGGITGMSLAAWQDAKAALAKTGMTWKVKGVHANPKQRVTYRGAKQATAEHVVFVTFTATGEGIAALADEQTRTFAADGFCWGYGGEGPRGLASILTDLLVEFNGASCPADRTRIEGNLFRYVARQDMDTAWSLSPADLLQAA